MLSLRKLDRYIAWNVLFAMAIVLIVLVILESLFSLLGKLDDINGDYQFMDIVIYTVLVIPKKIYDFIPVSALIGCLSGLGSMASNNELVVMRATGISLWRMVLSVMKPTLILICIGVLVGEYVAPVTEQMAEMRKSIARSYNSAKNVWHREGNEFMCFNTIELNGILYGVNRFVFDDNMKLQETSFSQKAIFQKNCWIMEHVTRSQLIGDEIITEQKSTEIWKINLTTTLLKVVVMKPDSLSISGLNTYIDYLTNQGLDTGAYILAFWTKALQPLSIFSLVLVGISFVFGPLRSVSMGFRIVSGMITGVTFMIVQNLLGPSSLVFGFPPLLSVIIPVLICIVIGSVLLYRIA